MKRIILTVILFVTFSSAFAQAEEKALIEKAVLNYVEAFYEADTAKAYQSIAKHLAKRGYYTWQDTVREGTMTFDQAIRLAKRWKNSVTITAETPKKITVLDIAPKIASAKLEAHWGIDYFHLAKINGTWMIINVLWQDYKTRG
jgi:hypothetical protein